MRGRFRGRQHHAHSYRRLLCSVILSEAMPPATKLPRIVRRRSKVHGWGVFTRDPINKNTRIIDYAGELIDHKESLKRETKYLEQGCIWCFTVNRRWVRDANVDGNLARFINHACKPNCYSQIVGKTIWIRAATQHRAGRRADLQLLHRWREDDSSADAGRGARRRL